MDSIIGHALNEWVTGQQDRALLIFYRRWPRRSYEQGKERGITFFHERTGVGYNSEQHATGHQT